MGIYRWSTERLDRHFRMTTTRITAAVALAKDDLCYMNSSGKMDKADATTDATCDTLLGVATESIAADKQGMFALWGMFNTTGLTVGIYYVSTTAGTWQNSLPTGTAEIVRIIGYATSTTEMCFHPDRTYIELN